MRSPVTGASWSSWGTTGSDTSWTGITVDLGGYVYAIRADGNVAYATESTSTWTSKGDAGSDTSWVDIGAFSSSGYIYAMRNDRSINRASTGSSSTWSSWSSAGNDTSWVAIENNGTHVFALKNDGIIDRSPEGATPNWNSPFADIGPGNAFVDFAVAIAEFDFIIIPIILFLGFIFYFQKRKKRGIQ
jgi:hypothetical protein